MMGPLKNDENSRASRSETKSKKKGQLNDRDLDQELESRSNGSTVEAMESPIASEQAVAYRPVLESIPEEDEQSVLYEDQEFLSTNDGEEYVDNFEEEFETTNTALNVKAGYVNKDTKIKSGESGNGSIRVTAGTKIFVDITQSDKKKYAISSIKDGDISLSDGYKIKHSACVLSGLTLDEQNEIKEKSPDSNVPEVADRMKAVYDDFIGNDGMSGMVDHLSKTRYEDGDVRAFQEGDAGFDPSNMEHATNMAYVGDGSAAVFGFIGLIRSLKEGDDAWETYENVLDGMFGAAKTAEGIGKVIGSATGDKTAADTGVLSEMLTHEISAIKNAFLMVKKANELFKLHDEMSTKDKAFQGASMLQDAVSMAQEAMFMTKNIQELLNMGTIGAEVMASIPGLGIAINAIDLIQQVFYLGIAIKHKRQMDKYRGGIAEGVSDKTPHAGNKEAIHGSKANHGRHVLKDPVRIQRQHESKIANLEAVIAMDQSNDIVVDRSIVENTEKYGGFLHRHESTYKKAKKRVKNHTRTLELKEELAQEKEELAAFNERVQSSYGTEEFENYGLAKELSSIGQKRINRTIIHITSDILSIVGDVLNLSGVGAMAGGITKASGAAVEASSFLLRTGKQAFNTKGARQQVKGKDTVFSRNSDATKSRYAKFARRRKHAVQILKSIQKIDETGTQEEVKAQMSVARSFVGAAGGSIRKLSTFETPNEMVIYLMECMQERER